MAEKDSQKLQFSRGSCTSRACRHPSVKVVYIGNPTMVTTTVSEFPAVVQFYTGRGKRSSADLDESTQTKAPKLEGRSKNSFISRRAEPEIAPMSNDINSKHGDCDINSQEFKDVEAQSNEVSDILNTQIFDTLENIGDGLFFGQFSPHQFYDQCI